MSRKSFLERGPGGAKSKKQSAAYYRSKKQEKELEKRGKGRRTPGSGNREQKGDVARYNGVFRVEAKTTAKKSFSVTRDMIEKIEAAALPHNELPAIIVEFIDERGKPQMEVAVVPTYVLDSVLSEDQ